MAAFTRLPLMLLCLLPALQACQAPPRGSEEYWYNKLRDEQRAQCRLLPSPLSESCIQDVSKKNYQQFLRQRQQEQAANQQANQPAPSVGQ